MYSLQLQEWLCFQRAAMYRKSHTTQLQPWLDSQVRHCCRSAPTVWSTKRRPCKIWKRKCLRLTLEIKITNFLFPWWGFYVLFVFFRFPSDVSVFVSQQLDAIREQSTAAAARWVTTLGLLYIRIQRTYFFRQFWTVTLKRHSIVNGSLVAGWMAGWWQRGWFLCNRPNRNPELNYATQSGSRIEPKFCSERSCLCPRDERIGALAFRQGKVTLGSSRCWRCYMLMLMSRFVRDLPAKREEEGLVLIRASSNGTTMGI